MLDLIKCDECGKMFIPGNNEQGLPNGVGFQLQDGSIYSVCFDCICKVGEDVLKGK